MDMQAMAKAGWVESSGPFFEDAMRLLASLKETNKGTGNLGFRVPAQTEMDQWIELVFRLSLGIPSEAAGRF